MSDSTQLGQLQQGFNDMAAGLRERERIRELWGRHVGEQVAQASTSAAVVLGGETRTVTVRLVDAVGSTSLAQHADPQQVVRTLNAFFEVVVEKIERRHGVVNEFTGGGTARFEHTVIGDAVNVPRQVPGLEGDMTVTSAMPGTVRRGCALGPAVGLVPGSPGNDVPVGEMSVNRMAAAATLHCLTGCSIGEIVGLVIGSAAGLSNLTTIAVSVGLAFVFGYTLSSLPLLKAGLPARRVARVVLVSDTVSILTMEVVDNASEAVIPGALAAGLSDSTFWWSMLVSLTIAYGAAYPVNRALLRRGQGHAVTHDAYANAPDTPRAWRRFLPAPPPPVTAAVITAFISGAWLAAGAGAFS